MASKEYSPSQLNVLTQTPPLTSVPKGDLKLLLTNLEVIYLASDDSYVISQKASPSNILPLQEQSILRKERKVQPYPIYIWLLAGGLWPVRRKMDADLSASIEPVGDALLGVPSETDFKKIRDSSDLLLVAFVHSSGLGVEQVTKQCSRSLTLPLSAQLAHILLQLQETINGEAIVPYKQRLIAILLGSFRETVSALIREFLEQCWVGTSTGNIRMLDLPKLQETASLYWRG